MYSPVALYVDIPSPESTYKAALYVDPESTYKVALYVDTPESETRVERGELPSLRWSSSPLADIFRSPDGRGVP